MAGTNPTDPEALPGFISRHDPFAPLPRPTRDSRIVTLPSIDDADIRHITLRIQVYAGRNQAQKEVIGLVDDWMTGVRGPHMPVMTYTIDEEEQNDLSTDGE